MVCIVNDGTGTPTHGNYDVRLLTWHDPPRVWRKGRVEGFPRQRLGPYDLLLRALATTVGARNAAALAELGPMDGWEAEDGPAQASFLAPLNATAARLP